jgi:hypothetical protein
MQVTVTHPDGSPAVNESISVRVNNWRRGFNYNETYQTDAYGAIHLALPLQEMEENQVTSIGIQIVSASYNYSRDSNIHVPYEPRTFHNIKRWFSPSDTFLQVAPIHGSATCGSVLRANITYTTHEDKVYKIHYQVCDVILSCAVLHLGFPSGYGKGQHFTGKLQNASSCRSRRGRRLLSPPKFDSLNSVFPF